jgi:hypothetical protein
MDKIMYCKRPTMVLCFSIFFLKAYQCGNFKPYRKEDYKSISEENSTAGKPKAAQPIPSIPTDVQNNAPFDFVHAIENLRKEADRKRGIDWSMKGDVLTRDATKLHGVVYASEDYAVQIMSMYRAASRLCELYGICDSGFGKMAKEFMFRFEDHLYYRSEPEYFWIGEVKRINKATIHHLQKVFPEINQKALNKNIRLVENYAGMEDRHYNITTHFKAGGKHFALQDNKWLKLTKAQRSDFEHRKSKKWYQSLPELEQKLVDRYLEKFLDDTHYFPTQIRNLPGCRNAYQKRVLAYDPNENPTVLGTYAHLGTLASFVDDQSTSEQILRANWEQIGAHVDPTEPLKVVCLNHKKDIKPIGYVGEKQIVEQTQSIVGDAAFTCFPINLIGTFTTPVLKKPVQELLNETATTYAVQYPEMTQLLMQEYAGQQYKIDFQKKLAEIQNPNDRLFFSSLYPLKKASERSDFNNKVTHNLEVDKNYYADLAANYVACIARLDAVKGRSGAGVAISCKSGKDRTGYVSFLTDTKLIESHLVGKTDTSSIHDALTRTGHIQLLASLNGGMPGRFGIKGKGIKKSRVNDWSHEALFRPSASLTGLPVS